MFLNLRITYGDDKTKDVKAVWDDFIAFEDEFDQPFTIVVDPKKSRLKYTTWLCWHSEFREKQTELNFNDWVKSISHCGFAPENEVEDVRPLGSKAHTGA